VIDAVSFGLAAMSRCPIIARPGLASSVRKASRAAFQLIWPIAAGPSTRRL
jgi:hypothetical protein